MLNDDDERITFGLPDIGIPAEALFHPDLTATEKILFGFLRNLSQSSKGCWATNKYLGKFLGLKKQTVSKAVSKLEKLNFIILVFDEGKDRQTIRRIFINPDVNKIYRDLVRDFHDTVESNTYMTKIIGGDCTKIIGGYDKNLRKYVNEEVNIEDVKDDSKESSRGISEEMPIRKRKRKQSSMKEKTKQKAQQRSSSKKKQNDHVPYENIANTQLLDVWNKQDNLRSHKTRTSKVYKDTMRKLESLRQGTLYKSVSKDMLQSDDVPYEWLSTKWKKKDISKAIKTLNEWCKEGNYPKNKEWIKKLSLSDAVFNPRTGSPIMQAFKRGVKAEYDPIKNLQSDDETVAYSRLARFFADILEKKDVKTQKQLVDLVRNLSGQREQYKNNWKRYDPEYFGYGYVPCNTSALAIDYTEFLNGQYSDDFTPKKTLTPNGLKIGGFVWSKFEKAYVRRFGADPIKGPS